MNVQHDLALFDVPDFSEDAKSVFMYSDDESCKKWVAEKLRILKSGYSVVFVATGLEENILDIVSKVKGKEAAYFSKDAKKVLIRNYPEYFCVVDHDKIIKTILDEWVSTIYEYRAFYILDPGKCDTLLRVLRENAHSGKNILRVVMRYIDGYIESAQDAPNHDSYVVNLKNNLWDKIGGYV